MKILAGILPLVLVALLAGGAFFIWFGCRIEPGNGQIAVLTRKTGISLPADQLVAVEPGYKGVQLDVLGEGRYFRNPYTWDWEIRPITDIPAGSFAVLVRKFGQDLPKGEIIAPTAEFKGIVRDVLGTGKHRINPYAYEVRVYDDLRIMPGNVGVVTNLTGSDLFSGVPNDLDNNLGFLVGDGRKGVLKEVLKEGTHRLNPYIQSVVIVNVQSQRYEFSGEDAITFLTMDGFSISLEGTVEFNIQADSAPRLTHEVGDMEDILKKLILPSVSGFARIEGSKKSATEFIVGESRQVFQDELEKFLRAACQTWGIAINSVLIRDIIPPQEIAEIIRNRELAQQEAKKFKQQIEQAKSATELEQQRMLALQRREVVNADTLKITSLIAAEQAKMEMTIAARTQLQAATVAMQKAEADAEAKLNLAAAEQQVIAARNTAEVEVLKRHVLAYGSAENYVTGLLYEKIAPKIESILTRDKGDLLGLPLNLGHGGK